MTPAVTVLMSVYNDAAYVGEAVRSILDQTFSDFELLVIDDGSSDGTSEIVAGFRDARVRILRNLRNLGLTASLNIGLAAARGELVARHDSDDYSLPERLHRQVAFLAAHPATVLVGSEVRIVNERGRPVRGASGWRRCITARAIEWQMMFENAFAHSSVMFRRGVILGELGGYDERLRSNQDFELWSRVLQRHAATNLDEPLVVLRGRPHSLSKNYSLESIRRVGDQLLENRARALHRTGQWDEGLRLLLAVFNPAVCAPVHDLEPLLDSIREMLARFEYIHPDADANGEIRRHVASLLIRIANGAAPHAPVAAARTLRVARDFDYRATWRSVPLAAARALLGAVVGRGRPTGTEQLALPARSGPKAP